MNNRWEKLGRALLAASLVATASIHATGTAAASETAEAIPSATSSLSSDPIAEPSPSVSPSPSSSPSDPAAAADQSPSTAAAETPEDTAIPPTPTPTPDRSLEISEAVFLRDAARVQALLAEGLDPNTVVPVPAPKEWLRANDDNLLSYYLSRETGFTILMLACGQGNVEMVDILLAAGADPHRRSKRSRVFPLHLATQAKSIEIMRRLMKIEPGSEAARTRIAVSLSTQTASLWRDGECLAVTPISSGRTSHPTPKGEYLVTDKYKTWKSTIYKVPMPYFLRLSCGEVGLHAGNLPGYPASHGCIRLPAKTAKSFYETVPVGTYVKVE